MKKFVFIGAILCVGIGLFIFYRGWESECDRLYGEYKTYVSSTDDHRYIINSLYRQEVDDELYNKESSLGLACLHTKPEVSIMVFKGLVESLNRPQFILGQKMRRSSAQVSRVALYYDFLASAYESKGYSGMRDDALKNKMKFEKEAANLKARER